MEKCNFFSIKFKEMLPFIYAFTLMFLFLSIRTKLGTSFTFDGAVDASENWKIASALANGEEYHSYVEYRGYMWVSILSTFHLFAKFTNLNPIFFLNIFNAFVFAGLGAKSLPFLFEMITKTKISIFRQIIFITVLFYFFQGHFLYPLTDFISFYFAIWSLNYLLEYKDLHKVRSLLMSSILIACALLIRGNYKITVLFELIILSYFIYKNGWQALVKNILIFTIPIMILSFTNNLYVNNLHLTTSEKGVLLAQLNAGLNIQKIDPVVYKNNIGIQLMQKNGFALNHIFSVKEYLLFVLKNPIDFTLIYTQNLFNGLDIKDNTVYFADNSHTVSIFSLVNYSLLFFGFFVILQRLYFQTLKSIELLCFSAILIPALITVAFGMEPRYLMPLTVVIYMYSIFGFNIIDSHVFKYNILIILYIFFILFCFLLSIKTNFEVFL